MLCPVLLIDKLWCEISWKLFWFVMGKRHHEGTLKPKVEKKNGNKDIYFQI